MVSAPCVFMGEMTGDDERSGSAGLLFLLLLSVVRELFCPVDTPEPGSLSTGSRFEYWSAVTAGDSGGIEGDLGEVTPKADLTLCLRCSGMGEVM